MVDTDGLSSIAWFVTGRFYSNRTTIRGRGPISVQLRLFIIVPLCGQAWPAKNGSPVTVYGAGGGALRWFVSGSCQRERRETDFQTSTIIFAFPGRCDFLILEIEKIVTATSRRMVRKR